MYSPPATGSSPRWTGTPEGEGFRAADLWKDDRTVCLHVFRPDAVEAAGGLKEMTVRFDAIREAPAHPTLATLLDFAGWRDTGYLAAEWTDGYPLRAVLQGREPLTVPEALRIARHAARGDHPRPRAPAAVPGPPATGVFGDVRDPVGKERRVGKTAP